VDKNHIKARSNIHFQPLDFPTILARATHRICEKKEIGAQRCQPWLQCPDFPDWCRNGNISIIALYCKTSKMSHNVMPAHVAIFFYLTPCSFKRRFLHSQE